MTFPRTIGPWSVKEMVKINNCLIIDVSAADVFENVILKVKITDYSLKPTSLEFDAARIFTDLIPIKYSWSHVFGIIEIPNEFMKAEFPNVTYSGKAMTPWMAMYKGVPAQYDVRIYDDVCTQLTKMHQAGYYHGDIKCNNIIRYNGKYTLIDFEYTQTKALYDTQPEDCDQKLYNIVMGFGDSDGLRSYKYERRGLLISVIALKYPNLFKPIYAMYYDMLSTRTVPNLRQLFDYASSTMRVGLEEKNDHALLEQLNFLSSAHGK